MASILIQCVIDALNGDGSYAGWLAFADDARRSLQWFLRATVWEDGSIEP